MSNLEALSLSESALPRVVVHSSVVFNILNSHSRRNAVESRVIGTLLGEVKDNVVLVSECFAVPFVENLQESTIRMSTDYHEHMYKYHRRNNKREVVVGWFATSTASGQLLAPTSSVPHEYYATQVASSTATGPIHLVVDTTLIQDVLSVRAFVGRESMIGPLESFCNTYQEIRVDIEIPDCDASVLHTMLVGQAMKSQKPGGGGNSKEFSDSVLTAPFKQSSSSNAAGQVTTAIKELQSLLVKLQSYVDQVVEGKITNPSREVGILLTEALSIASQQNLSMYQVQALQTRYDDLMMIAYLTTLTQAQTVISEKLNQIL